MILFIVCVSVVTLVLVLYIIAVVADIQTLLETVRLDIAHQDYTGEPFKNLQPHPPILSDMTYEQYLESIKTNDDEDEGLGGRMDY